MGAAWTFFQCWGRAEKYYISLCRKYDFTMRLHVRPWLVGCSVGRWWVGWSVNDNDNFLKGLLCSYQSACFKCFFFAWQVWSMYFYCCKLGMSWKVGSWKAPTPEYAPDFSHSCQTWSPTINIICLFYF